MSEPGFGHNKAPLSEELLADLRATTASLEERKASIIASLPKVAILDQNDIGRAADTAKIIQTVLDEVEAKRKGILAPVYEARDMVNGAADRWTAELEAGKIALGKLVDDFKAAQRKLADDAREAQDKIERERAAANRVEIARPAPVAPPPKPTKTVARGDYGGKATSRPTLELEITDLTKIPVWILDSTPVREAILSVARPMAQRGVTIEGITVTRGEKTAFL